MTDGAKHHSLKDMTGRRFGSLTVLRQGPSQGHGSNSVWWVQCDCGAPEKLVSSAGWLRTNRKPTPVSCGCKMAEAMSLLNRTHGMSKHPAFAVWRSMLDRCRLPTNQAWHNYGGRGITVCERWQHSFENFWADMGPTYQRGLTLDRLDNDKGYSPDNCAWRTVREQNRNRRDNRFMDTPWGRMTVSEASERSGIGVTTLLYRLGHGCPTERLLDKPDFQNRFSTS